MTERLLVIAAHPDDEVLGCGGTIAKLNAQGAHAHIASLADGVSTGDVGHPIRNSELNNRREATEQVCDAVGGISATFDGLPDNRLDTVALLDIVRPIESLIAEHRPDTVFTHHSGDLNIDHRRVHQAVMTAGRNAAIRCARCSFSMCPPVPNGNRGVRHRHLRRTGSSIFPHRWNASSPPSTPTPASCVRGRILAPGRVSNI